MLCTVGGDLTCLQAREAYRQHDQAACEEQCLALLIHAFLPNYARIETLLLLSGVVKISKSFGRLDEALAICDEIEARRADDPLIRQHRELAAALRKEFVEALDLEKSEKGAAKEVDEATGVVG